MKQLILVRLLSVTLVLTLALMLTSCQETEVKPEQNNATSSILKPKLNGEGGVANTGGGQSH